MKRSALLWILLLAPLPLSASNLYLDLRTNYDPRTDFRIIRVQCIDRRDERRSWNTVLAAASSGDFVRGERIAEFENMDRGTYVCSVELLDRLMRPVHGRLWLVSKGDEAQAATMLISRP